MAEYSRDQLMQALRKADAAGDTDGARRIAQMVQGMQGDTFAPQQLAPPPTMWERTKDVFTGSLRETRATRELPELGQGGLLAKLPTAQKYAVSSALMTTADDEEVAKIVQASLPNVAKTYDEKGNIILTDRETGQSEIVNKPGVSRIDVMRGATLGAAYTPAGRAATIAGAAGRSALTETALQAYQKGMGGTFDPSEIAISAGSGAAGQKLTEVLGSMFPAVSSIPVEELAPGPNANRDVIVRAIKSGELPKTAVSLDIDPAIMDAVKRLGLQDDVLASYVANNPTYRELEQGLAALPASSIDKRQREFIVNLAQKADDLITMYGGTLDRSDLSKRVLRHSQDTIKDLRQQASVAYDAIDASIPVGQIVETPTLSRLVSSESAKMGGNLDPLLRDMQKLIEKEGGVTYHLLDRERKKIVEALTKRTGPYKKRADYELKQVRDALNADQEIAANTLGLASQWRAAKQLVAKRKELEQNSLTLFGADLLTSVMPGLGQNVLKLSKGDMGDFQRIMNAMPPDMREETIVSALNTAFTQGSQKEKQLNLPGFANWWNGLERNPQAKQMLFQYMPVDARKRLDSLAKVANGVRRARESRIQTGRTLAIADIFEQAGPVERLVNAVISGTLRATQATGLTGSGLVPGILDFIQSGKKSAATAADELLASPNFRTAIESLAVQGVPGSERAIRRLERTREFKKWLRSLSKVESQAILSGGLGKFLERLPDTYQQQTEAAQATPAMDMAPISQ